MNRIVEKVNFAIPKQPKAKRVAAYARVSSGKLSKRKAIDRIISDLSKRGELLTEFDNCLWLTVVDTVTVRKDGTLIFKFNDDTEIEG